MYRDFAECLQKYFDDYLVRERGVSKHTIRSYRDTFVSFIDYLTEYRKVKLQNLSMDMMDKECLLSFLNWLEQVKQCSIQTRNHRLACMRSFFTYMMYLDPTHLGQWKGICTIKRKKCVHEELNYLTIEGVTLLLQEIDTSSLQGLRNLTLISLLYNAGMRVQELVDLTPSCLRTSKPYVLNVFGKGAKTRAVPLDEPIVELVKKYIHESKLDQPGKDHHPLFYNTWHEKLTPAGVAHIINKYFKMAKIQHPDVFPNKISPHVFRHSRAMHLLQAGVNLIYIRDILGHVSIQTTEIYARVDSEPKRTALEKAYASIGITEPEIKIWSDNNKLKEFLKNYTY